MSDILGDTDGLGLVLYSGTRDELQAKLRARDDEITRLRSLLKEAGEALELCVASLQRGTDAAVQVKRREGGKQRGG